MESKKKITDLNFDSIPTPEQFEKIKVKSKTHWYNSLLTFLILTIGISLGVIFCHLLVVFFK